MRFWAMVHIFLMAGLPAAWPADSAARVLTDHTGRQVSVPERPQRIVSLAPNLTETLFALGAGDRVVGVTDFCDYPAHARSKAKVGGIINPSIEAVVSLKPDLVLITREGNRRETMEALERLKISVFAVGTDTMAGVFRMIRDVGAAAGLAGRGEQLARRLEAESAAVERALRGQPPRRVLLLVWLQPVVSAGRGTFLDDLLRRSGAESISATLSAPWPHLSIEEIIRSDPEYLLIPRTPWFGPTREELLQHPGFRELKAVQENRIVYLPAAVERPGPRLGAVQSLIARELHPGAFPAKAARTSGPAPRAGVEVRAPRVE